MLYLILVLLHVDLFAQRNHKEGSILAKTLTSADSARYAELFRNLEEVVAQEPNHEQDARQQALRQELISSAQNPAALKYFVNQADSLGLKYRRLFQMRHALYWYQLEYDLARKGGLISNMVQALNNVGLIYRRTDKYEAAIEAYQKALVLSDSAGLSRSIVYALNGLGNIYLELGNLDEAMLNFRECLRMEQDNNNLTGIAINLNNIGHVYKEYGDLERAMEYFLLSLEVNQEIPSQRGIAICYNDIGEIYRMRGDNDKALSYFEHSLNINKLIGDLYYLGINHLKVAEIYFERGDLKALRPYLDEAIRLSELTNNLSNLMKSYRIKYQTERAYGNIGNAITFLEKAWALNDSILNENMQRKLLQMQATFNRERSNNHIALLQNEKALAELRLKRQKDYTIAVTAGLILLFILMGLLAYLLQSKNKAVTALRQKNKEMEQARLQLAEYNQQLLSAKQEAELSNKLKSQFLANISHEIRTPLNSVIGFADLLSEKITDPVKLSYLESIRSSGRSLLMLIEDILDLSKIEAGKFSPELHSMSINNLFLELRRIFEIQAFQKNIVLTLFTSPEFPEVILLHEGSLRQIMVNLLGNALKFTEAGQISAEATVLNKRGDVYDLKISVKDTGRGIASEHLNHIFDAFYQAPSNFGSQKGTGLGLTITKRLIDSLNGTIEVKSVVDEGTTFDLIFNDVKAITYRTAFRLAQPDRQASPVALISTDNILMASIDALLIELGLTCDLIDDIQEMQSYLTQPACHLLLLDAQLASNFEASIATEESECKLILIAGRTDHPPITINKPHKVVLLPDELEALKAEIMQTLFGKNLNLTTTTGLNLEPHQLNPDESTLIEAYKKAIESQLVQDVIHFAKLLIDYSDNYGDNDLGKIGRSLDQTAKSIDIEMMNNLMNDFSKHFRPQHHNA